jgi:hypothetical protein
MNNLNKSVLIVINLIGAIAMIISLVVPFIVPVANTAALVLAIWMMITGFVLWYISIKFLEEKSNL